MIIFDEESHTYKNPETGRNYISATTLLNKYKTYFNSKDHALRVSAREGVTPEFILETWAAETKRATDRGTNIHALMENYIKTGIVKEDYNYLYRSYDRLISKEIGKFDVVLSETRMSLHEYELAGTADIIYESEHDFIIADFKTNKRFRFANDFKEYFLQPIAHLSMCEFNTYSLQLSLYAYMYEQATGKKCKKLVTFYLKEDEWVPYYSNYLKTDILNILNHFKKS